MEYVFVGMSTCALTMMLFELFKKPDPRLESLDQRFSEMEKKLNRARVVNVYHHGRPTLKGSGTNALIPVPRRPTMDL